MLSIFELCLSMKKTDEKVAKNRTFLASSAVVTIALVGFAIWLIFAFQVNRPISNLVQAMRRAEGGDLSARVRLPGRDELGSLGRSLNSMIEKLDATQREVEHFHTEQLIRAERLASIGELAANVAHEIKNPLAGISGAVQVLADDFPKGDPRREVTDQILHQSERMDKTIRDLLNYAQPLHRRAEPRGRQRDPRPGQLHRAAEPGADEGPGAPRLRRGAAPDDGRRQAPGAGLPEPHPQRDAGHARRGAT